MLSRAVLSRAVLCCVVDRYSPHFIRAPLSLLTQPNAAVANPTKPTQQPTNRNQLPPNASALSNRKQPDPHTLVHALADSHSVFPLHITNSSSGGGSGSAKRAKYQAAEREPEKPPGSRLLGNGCPCKVLFTLSPSRSVCPLLSMQMITSSYRSLLALCHEIPSTNVHISVPMEHDALRTNSSRYVTSPCFTRRLPTHYSRLGAQCA